MQLQTFYVLGNGKVGINDRFGGTHFEGSIDNFSHILIKQNSNIPRSLLIIFFKKNLSKHFMIMIFFKQMEF